MNEEHLYTSEQKKEWFGYGEWVEELDYVDFIHAGLQCKVIRLVHFEWDGSAFGGYLCAYVEIPEGHFLYNNVNLSLDKEVNFDIHGGITHNVLAEGFHIIGFDCAHSCDYVPSTELFKKNIELFPIPEEFKKYSLFNPVYRNMNYVIEECKCLANQISKLEICKEKNDRP